jgi:hypothetical protein
MRALEQRVVALGLLERVRIRALPVLDDLQLERLGVGELAHDRGHVDELRHLRGAEAALAGDDLEAFAQRPRDDRLDDALRADARGELSSFSLSKILRWLSGEATASRAGSTGDARPARRRTTTFSRTALMLPPSCAEYGMSSWPLFSVDGLKFTSVAVAAVSASLSMWGSPSGGT